MAILIFFSFITHQVIVSDQNLYAFGILDTMLSSLVELLEEKGIITQQEWEKRIKERVTIE